MRIESNTRKNIFLGIGVFLFGALMLSLTRGRTDHSRDHQLLHIIGLLFLFVGTAVIVLHERVLILVSPHRKTLTMRKSSLRGRELRIIPFASIQSVDVITLGQTHKGTRSYHLNLTLKTGEKIRTGRSSRVGDEIHGIARELSDLVGLEPNDTLRAPSTELAPFLFALLGAVLVYGIWYRLSVGPWCRAMWFGTAPPVIMLLAFMAIILGFPKRRT